MNYLQLSIDIAENETRELLIAALSEEGVEGFEEDETNLKAFISEADYANSSVIQVLSSFGLNFTSSTIAPRNWNAEWEAAFEPVIVEDFCTIRAHFHDIDCSTKYEVIITPKMSFGTGHHATTHLMIQQMEYLNFSTKRVLDFGTGTGVLAILAEKLGATDVLAIDNDEWSLENAQENVVLNNCSHIKVSMEPIDSLDLGKPFDLILANINRHILLKYMNTLKDLLSPTGTLLMSGLLIEDDPIVSKAASDAGLNLQSIQTRNNWITILCKNL